MTIVTALLNCGLICFALVRAISMSGLDSPVVPGKRTGRKCGS